MIPINKYSRSGRPLKRVLGIVIHWPEWAGASAKRIHDYFAVVDKEKRFASAHYVVGLDGEIEQCIPEEEMAYHCGTSNTDPESGKLYTDKAREVFGVYADDEKLSPNMVSIGIEVCHVSRKGEMTPATVKALIGFVAELCHKHGLGVDKVLRHYDVVGWKNCPRYWVDHPDLWHEFIDQVSLVIEQTWGPK